MREYRLRLRQHVLLGVLRVLLLGERCQLVSREHRDGRLVEGGQLVFLRRPAVLHGLQFHLRLRERLRQRLLVLRDGLRPDHVRLRPAGLQLLRDRLLPVPLRAVQPERRLPGADRLPGRGLRPPMDGGSLVHHRRRRRQHHGGAERAVLDDGPAGPAAAAVPLARHELPGRRCARECRRRRLRRAHLVRPALRLRGLPERRRRVRGHSRRPDRRRGDLSDRGLLPGRGRRRHLHLRRGPFPRLHGRPAAERPGGRHGGDADGPRLLARRC